MQYTEYQTNMCPLLMALVLLLAPMAAIGVHVGGAYEPSAGFVRGKRGGIGDAAQIIDAGIKIGKQISDNRCKLGFCCDDNCWHNDWRHRDSVCGKNYHNEVSI
jgi:hypothetical protein